MRHEEHGGPSCGRGDHGAVDDVPPVGVQAGVRLVEQEQLGATGEADGQRTSAPLTGGEPAMRHPGQWPEIQGVQYVGCTMRTDAGRASVQAQIPLDRKDVVAARLLADERDTSPVSVGVRGQVHAQHGGHATGERQDAGEEAQQAGLARAIRTRDENELTATDLEIQTGEERESVDHRQSTPEVDDGRDSDRLIDRSSLGSCDYDHCALMAVTLSLIIIRSPAIYFSAFTLLAAAGCGPSADDRSAAPCVNGTDVVAAGELGRAGTAIAVAAVDDRFEPGCVEVERGPVTIVVRNEGRHPHNLTMPDGASVSVDAGQVAFLDTSVTAGRVRYTCTIHPGMDGELTTP